MDKIEKRDWSWLRSQAPELSAVISELRLELGSDWINACWTHGVIQREAGWFFAKIGPVALGTSWADIYDDLLRYEQAHDGQTNWGPPMVIVRRPGGERTAWGTWVYDVRGFTP